MKSNNLIYAKIPSNRKFGWLFSIITAFSCAYFYWKAEESLSIFLGLASALFAIFAVVAPNFLEPFNKAWFTLGLLIGKIVNPMVLGIIYFMVIFPTALVMRLFGRDELLMKKRHVLSYWVAKDPADPNSFKNQF
jgi:hypothetical protein